MNACSAKTICPKCSGAPLGSTEGPIGLLFPPVHTSRGWTRVTFACDARVPAWSDRRQDNQARAAGYDGATVVCGAAMMREAVKWTGPEHSRQAVVLRRPLPSIQTYRTQHDPDTGIVLDESRIRCYTHHQLQNLWWWIGILREEKAKKLPLWWRDILSRDFVCSPGSPDDPRGERGRDPASAKFLSRMIARRRLRGEIKPT